MKRALLLAAVLAAAYLTVAVLTANPPDSTPATTPPPATPTATADRDRHGDTRPAARRTVERVAAAFTAAYLAPGHPDWRARYSRWTTPAETRLLASVPPDAVTPGRVATTRADAVGIGYAVVTVTTTTGPPLRVTLTAAAAGWEVSTVVPQ